MLKTLVLCVIQIFCTLKNRCCFQTCSVQAFRNSELIYCKSVFNRIQVLFFFRWIYTLRLIYEDYFLLIQIRFLASGSSNPVNGIYATNVQYNKLHMSLNVITIISSKYPKYFKFIAIFLFYKTIVIIFSCKCVSIIIKLLFLILHML